MNDDIASDEQLQLSPDDVIHARLNALHSDVDRVRFAPAGLIRARAQARTRRRVAAVAAAVVLVAGLGYLGRGGAGFLRTQLPQPPAVSGSAVPSGSATHSGSAAPSGSVTDSGSATPSGSVTPMVITPGGGPVGIGYYLPGRLWAGSDLDNGAATGFGGPFEPEGSIAMYECDSAEDAAGHSAFLPVAETGNGRHVGLQRVQLLASPEQAVSAVAAAQRALSACRLPSGANATLEVTFAPASSNTASSNTASSNTASSNTASSNTASSNTASSNGGGVAGGHLVLARVRTTTLDTAQRSTTWVAVVAVDEGSAVTTLVVRQPPVEQAGWDTVQRLAAAAADQLRQAQSR